jgi:hypothetical protein
MFDELTGDFASDFMITAYDGRGEVIYNGRFKDVGEPYFSSNHGVLGVWRVRYDFYGTNKPYRRLRVVELNYGVVVRFDGEDIMDLKLISQGDARGECFPLPSFSLTVANKGRFDQMDGDSLAHYLYKRQPFEYRHGVYGGGGVEWVNCGTYYLDNWSVTDEEVRFSSVGRVDLLDGRTYVDSTFAKRRVGDLIKWVMDGIGYNCYIAPILFDAPFVCGYFGDAGYRKVLGYLAELSCCMGYEDRYNVVTFADVLEGRAHTEVVDYDNTFGTPKITHDTYYNGIRLVVRRMSTRVEQLAKAAFEVNGSRDVTVKYLRPLLRGGAVEVTPGFAVQNVRYNATYMTARLVGNGVAELTVTGEGVEFINEEIFCAAPWKDPIEGELPYVVNLPVMIDDGSAEFAEFRDWFLRRKFELLKRRLTCDVTWRQNPGQLVGDRVLMQVNRQNSRVPMYAVKQVVEFKGGVLRGRTTAVGL